MHFKIGIINFHIFMEKRIMISKHVRNCSKEMETVKEELNGSPITVNYANIFFQRASLVAQMVKNLRHCETPVRSLGQEDPLEKGMATHSSILAWRIPWTEEPGRLQPWDRKELDMTEQLSHTHTHCFLIPRRA